MSALGKCPLSCRPRVSRTMHLVCLSAKIQTGFFPPEVSFVGFKAALPHWRRRAFTLERHENSCYSGGNVCNDDRGEINESSVSCTPPRSAGCQMTNPAMWLHEKRNHIAWCRVTTVSSNVSVMSYSDPLAPYGITGLV